MPKFRSHLEIMVARELDEHSVRWQYEQRVVLPDGRSPRYLPDFLIETANPELRLPQWVECKPQNFLYALRDLLGVTRKYGDRFAGEVTCEGVSSETLRGLLVEELWKPKMLAELTGESVLVVGTVGAVASLSIEMRPDRVCFSREHPFVNWVGIQRAKEREQKRLQWEAEAAERQRLWQLQQDQRRQAMVQSLSDTLQFRHLGPTKWNRSCFGCGDLVQAGSGSLRKVAFVDGAHEWRVLCSSCCQGSAAPQPQTAQSPQSHQLLGCGQ